MKKMQKITKILWQPFLFWISLVISLEKKTRRVKDINELETIRLTMIFWIVFEKLLIHYFAAAQPIFAMGFPQQFPIQQQQRSFIDSSFSLSAPLSQSFFWNQ